MLFSRKIWFDIITIASGFISDGFIKKYKDVDNSSESIINTNSTNNGFMSVSSNNFNSTSSEVDLNEGLFNKKIIENIESDVYALIFCILCLINLIARFISFKNQDSKKVVEEVRN